MGITDVELVRISEHLLSIKDQNTDSRDHMYAIAVLGRELNDRLAVSTMADAEYTDIEADITNE